MSATEPIFEKDTVEADKDDLGFDLNEFQSIKNGGTWNFKHDVNYRRGFAAASVNNLKVILTQTQLKQCAYEWINNGMIRQCVNKLVWHLLGQRTKFLVQPNDELTEFVKREELAQTITNILGESENRVPELQQKFLRANKRCELHDRTQKLVKNTLIFGRNFLGIERFGKQDGKGIDPITKKAKAKWNIFGEPKALKVMNSLRIVDTAIDENTYEFAGFYYDYGTKDRRKDLIKPTDMIPLWNDDDNVLDMTYYSGTSAVWTALSVAQAIDVMNDEDVPEYVKKLYRKIGHVYTGATTAKVTTQVREELEKGDILVHGRKNLSMSFYDVAGTIMDIMNAREASAKFIAWSLAIPLFIIFEDTSNFATANQALQAFKVGTLDRMRTWIQNALEKYWYDPMIADHLNIPLDQVIAARIKVKAVIEDIIYDTPTDIANKEVALVGAGIHTPLQALENMGEDKFIEELKQAQDEKAKAKEEAIKNARAIIAANGFNPDNANTNNPFNKSESQPGDPNQSQQSGN